MWVAVAEVGARAEQRACLAQVAAHRPVGRVELRRDHRPLPAHPRPVGAEQAVVLDREDRIDAVRLGEQEIFLAEVRRHVDEAGAGVCRDMRGGEEGARLGEETAEMMHRVASDGAGQKTALEIA